MSATNKDDDPPSPLSDSKHRRYGSVSLILGPMFSGKSTELLRRIRRYTIAQKKCLVVKYQLDDRYSAEKMSTHDLQMWESFPATKLSQIPQNVVDQHDVIGVDEGQFFPDIVEWCDEQAQKHGKIVVISALDGDFQRNPFGKVLQLIPRAEHVTKLHAVCMMCGADAPFTARLTAEEEVEVIGGADKYVAVCRPCHSRQAQIKSIPKITELFKRVDKAKEAAGVKVTPTKTANQKAVPSGDY